jgi:hypothetical protein
MLLSISNVKKKITVNLLALMVFAGCALPLGDDFTIPKERGNWSYIIDYNLQHYVPAAGGIAPVKAVLNRRDLEVTVVWRDEAGRNITRSLANFAENAVYQADITLTAKIGYTFDPEVNFQYPAETVTAQSDDDTDTEDPGRTQKRTVTVTYKAVTMSQAISDINLTSYIPVPVTDESPVSNFFTGNYGGTVVWKDEGVPLDGVFRNHTNYTAEVTLTPATGYAFATELTFAHTAVNSVISSSSYDADTGNVTIVFRTASLQVEQN